MLNEWSDRLPVQKAAELWERTVQEEVRRRTAHIEHQLQESVAMDRIAPAGFYQAMSHFLALRDKLFPDFPADAAWKILVTLTQTPEDSPKASITGIAHGAGVSLTTALRYIAAMEMQGILERAPHPEDKRQVMIRLTESGRRRLEVLANKWMARLLLLLMLPMALLVLAAEALLRA